jgi:hypothetical protein
MDNQWVDVQSILHLVATTIERMLVYRRNSLACIYCKQDVRILSSNCDMTGAAVDSLDH